MDSVDDKWIPVWPDEDAAEIGDIGIVADVGHDEWFVVFGTIRFDETNEVLMLYGLDSSVVESN